jgi:hypothetical protein
MLSAIDPYRDFIISALFYSKNAAIMKWGANYKGLFHQHLPDEKVSFFYSKRATVKAFFEMLC